MKDKAAKYVFFIIVIIMLIAACVIIYMDKRKDKTKLINNKNQINITKEINVGIAKYDTINPILTNNCDIQYLDKLIFESLINVTKDFQIENNLAEECSKVNSQTYIIKLKPNSKWHNGDEVTAEDIKFTVENLKNLKSIYTDNVKDIKEIEIIDKYILKMYLNKEVNFFEYLLTFPILSKSSYEQETLNSKTEIPIGSGKYKIVSMSEKEINLKSEEGEINVKIYDEIKDLYLAFSKEEIDIINTKNIEYQTYTGTIGINNNNSTDREYDYLAINTERDVLKNIEVRKAINYFIDKNKIIFNIFNNMYSTVNFPINPESYLYNEGSFDKFDINEGKKVLLDAGWKLKNNLWQKDGEVLEFYLLVNKNNEIRCKVAEEIKEQLNKNGINIKIIEANDYYYNQKIQYGNFDIALTGNILSLYPDLTTYLGEQNICNYKNKEVLEILKEVKNIQNKETLKEKYFKLEELYNNEMPFISLYINNNFILYNSKIKGDFSHNWFDLYYNINNWYKNN